MIETLDQLKLKEAINLNLLCVIIVKIIILNLPIKT